MILSLKRITNTSCDLIFADEDCVGMIGTQPLVEDGGRIVGPKIVLNRPQTQQTIERIKNLINRSRGTNRDIEVVKPPPSLTDPAIQRYIRAQGRQPAVW